MSGTALRRSLRRPLGLVILVVALLSASLALAADATLSVQDIDTENYPAVKMIVSLPPSLADQGEPEFSVLENGDKVSDLSVAQLTSNQSSTRVVLVIDTSGSMAGQPLDDATAAAQSFIDSLGQGAEVAIVAFADEARLVTGFTDDAAALNQAITSLDAAGETALYDGLRLAGDTVGALEPSARASIVVLSDGGDTVSDVGLSEVRTSFEKTGAPVYAIALQSKEYNSRPLELITETTQGRLVLATDSAGLTEVFEAIAKEITSAWELSYKSAEPGTADVEVDVVATVGDAQASAAVAYKNPAVAAASSAPVVFPTVSEDVPQLIVIAGLALLAVTLLVVGVSLIALRDRNTLDHLRYYDQLHEPVDLAGSGGTGKVRSAIVDAVDSVAGKRGLTQVATQKLEAAGWPLRGSEYMTMHIFAVVGIGLLVQLLSGNFALSVIFIILATVAPLLALSMAADRRRQRFEEQLPDTLTMIAGSLRGGWGIQQAIALAGQETGAPMGPELKRVETETRLGMPLERSLQAMSDRIESSDFHAAVSAIAIQREVGGNLAEVLDLVAKTVRERDAMRRQVKALTAEGRLSAYILIALPFFVALVLMMTSPEYLMTLFTSAQGLMLVFVGIVLLIVGSIWMYRVTKIEV